MEAKCTVDIFLNIDSYYQLFDKNDNNNYLKLKSKDYSRYRKYIASVFAFGILITLISKENSPFQKMVENLIASEEFVGEMWRKILASSARRTPRNVCGEIQGQFRKRLHSHAHGLVYGRRLRVGSRIGPTKRVFKNLLGGMPATLTILTGVCYRKGPVHARYLPSSSDRVVKHRFSKLMSK